ncbi:MAG TPA: metalloregulator ArsR/SmtB family transcription factor [bacterium]|nr:metalloregulator ArsR/SmtB family transcription factor [bacterium]
MEEINRIILNAREAIKNIDKCEKMADIFKVFGDAGRLKIVKALTAGELCASDIALVLILENSVVSHQLKMLKTAGVVSSRKEGKYIYYKIENQCVKKLFELVDAYLLNCK